MHLVYIADVRLPTPKAHGRQIVKTCEALAQEGHSVVLLIPKRRATRSPAEIEQYYGLEEGVIQLEQIAVSDLVRFGKIGFLLSRLQFSMKARRYVRRTSLDCVYTRDELPAAVCAGYAPVSYEVHEPRQNMVVRMAASKACCVVTISDGLRDWLREYVNASVPMEVVPDAAEIDHESFTYTQTRAREELGLPAAKELVCYIGTLSEPKGAYTVAHAAAIDPSSDRQYVFVGRYGSAGEAFSRRYHDGTRVTVYDVQPHDTARLFMAAADVLVLPNSARDATAAQYTSPMKLFEYMATGRPILAADVPAAREVLNKNTAYWHAPDDPTALLNALNKISAEPARARERAEQARTLVAQYTWKHRAQRIIEALAHNCASERKG